MEFYSKNKFQKLVYLVGFIIRTSSPGVTLLHVVSSSILNKLYNSIELLIYPVPLVFQSANTDVLDLWFI